MRQTKIRYMVLRISISILLLAMLACNAATGIQAAETEVPAMITAAPTVLGPMATAAAQFTPPAVGTSAPVPAGTLGISLADVRTVMDPTQQFTFKNGKVNGKPAAIASLSASAATTMPGLVDTFSAEFIGDPASLSEIKVHAPYSQDKTSIQTGITMITVLFSGILPPDVLLSFIPWITQNYSTVAVGAPKNMTAGKMKFVLSRTQTVVTLDIVPAG
jgi:hypothetical protein